MYYLQVTISRLSSAFVFNLQKTNNLLPGNNKYWFCPENYCFRDNGSLLAQQLVGIKLARCGFALGVVVLKVTKFVFCWANSVYEENKMSFCLANAGVGKNKEQFCLVTKRFS